MRAVSIATATHRQVNGPAERFKDSYLKTGHKNMLRKGNCRQEMGRTTDGVMYDTAATLPDQLTSAAATATRSAALTSLSYTSSVTGWPPAPAGLDVVVNMSGAAKYNGTSDYSCAACHTTGWSNTTATAGLCSLSSKTTQQLAKPNIRRAESGTRLAAYRQLVLPAMQQHSLGDSFPGITFGAAGTVGP